jgi:hypothetical protein
LTSQACAACRLPESALEQYNYYLDTQRLRIAVSNMKNSNTPEELERIKQQVRRCLPGAAVGLCGCDVCGPSEQGSSNAGRALGAARMR